MKGAQASDPEDDLLPDASVAIAAIELARNGAVRRQRILGNVGIEQDQFDFGDLDGPELDGDRTAGQIDRDGELVATRIEDGPDRERIEIVVEIPLLLPAVRVQVLAEGALLVKKA